jgi:predicted nuclease of predicted toxin-antitoxin system
VKLRLFADQCIPLEIVLAMRGLGHEVLLLRDHLPIRSVDTLVIAKAQELDCLLLSLNGDFADIVTYPPGSFGGILALQLHNHPETIPALMQHLGRYLDSQTDREFFRGKLFIVEVHRIRIRS